MKFIERVENELKEFEKEIRSQKWFQPTEVDERLVCSLPQVTIEYAETGNGFCFDRICDKIIKRHTCIKENYQETDMMEHHIKSNFLFRWRYRFDNAIRNYIWKKREHRRLPRFEE